MSQWIPSAQLAVYSKYMLAVVIVVITVLEFISNLPVITCLMEEVKVLNHVCLTQESVQITTS